jgi:hypothetical protein
MQCKTVRGILLLLLVAIVVPHDTASAATIVVTTGQDGAIGGVNGCSLREAVEAVNTQANGNGCNNSSSEPYGTKDRIRFSGTANNVALTVLANPISRVSLFVQRPVSIQGNGREVTIIDGGGGIHTLIENSSKLLLRSIQLRNAGTALRNDAIATANLVIVRVTGHSQRAVINNGLMTMLATSVSKNPGGGISNANSIPVKSLRGGFTASFNDTCRGDCSFPGDDGNSTVSTFPLGEAPAGLAITLSTVSNNGPVPCAGVVNGGGLSIDQGGITGGNPSITKKFEGALTLRRSRVTENDAGDSDGGGICNQSVALIAQSEISKNRAKRGAGIAASGLPFTPTLLTSKPLTIVASSTISSNSASTAGGGVFVANGGGDLHVKFSTIAFNVATGSGPGDAGGIASEGPLSAKFWFNALVDNRSKATGTPVQTCAGIRLDGDFNFWAANDTGTCPLTGTRNITTGDALLGPLAQTGDLTRLHVPASASALVDVVPRTNLNCTGSDQRLRTRPRDGNNDMRIACDIGAVERP